MPRHVTPPASVNFLNSLAFGVTTPPIYYMIALPFSKWIALLFVIDILGRFAGQPIGQLIQRELGARFTLAGSQAVNAVAYLLLVVVGSLRPAPAEGFVLIYFSRLLGAMASANLPAVRPANPDRSSRQGILSAQVGFAIGCLLTALIANHHPVPDSILVTGGLLVPAIVAAAISLAATGFAWMFVAEPQLIAEVEPSSTGVASTNLMRSALALGTMLACESAMAMIICVLPLTDREILAFSPATLGIYFAVLALLSAAVTRWTIDRWQLLPIALNLGILLSAIGFAGFSTALWLSWKYAATDGIAIATRVMWIAGVPAAIGHGLVRAALPWARGVVVGDPPAETGSLLVDGVVAAAAVVSVLFVSKIWAPHERASLAIPGAVLLLALPAALAILHFAMARRAGFFPIMSAEQPGPAGGL